MAKKIVAVTNIRHDGETYLAGEPLEPGKFSKEVLKVLHDNGAVAVVNDEKLEEPAEPAETKPEEPAKPAETKPEEPAKPVETKPAEPKLDEPKPEPKPEAKPSSVKK